MRKILQILLIFALFAKPGFVFAQDKNIEVNLRENFENSLNTDKEILFEVPVLLEEVEKPLFENEKTLEKLEAKIEENEFSNIAPNGILSDKLTIKFDKGLIKENKTEFLSFYGFSQNIDKKDSNFRFDVLYLKLAMLGKFRSGKENYIVTFNLTPNTHDNFFHNLPLDAYIESKRLKNHKIKIGTFRPNLGYDGSLALFLIPLLDKTQIARKFSNERKTGVSLNGDYKYFDYSIEGFSSDVKYESFFPGVEGNLWLDIKPLAKFDEKYGNLKVGGGYQQGKRNSTDYSVASAGLKYDYKNFWLIAEYAYSDGSNGGDGLCDKKRDGYNVTIGYLPCEKLELILRFDDFDNDKKISHNNTKEYTAGFNYYIYKEAVVLMVNYSYLQNDAKDDSHRFIIGAQLLI